MQGVGFRPFVWRLARDCGLRGAVRNDGRGVVVEAWGSAAALEDLLRRLRAEAPAAARIEAIEHAPLPGDAVPADFRILPSRGGGVRTGVMADAATCPECLAEILDPHDRRHRHPFANCTRCGPRLSILRAMPYDRHHTSMADFSLCPACAAEYRDPGNRRFHAQPIACPDCGPRLWLEDAAGKVVPGDPVAVARRLLQAGRILAVKGLGGFHLACDATSETAVARLRARKGRPHKPFALLARDWAMVDHHAHLDDTARALLESPAAPVVLLTARPHHGLATAVAPGQDSLGFMLPCTPLHHLLMEAMAAPLVFTSGNRSEAPPCIDNDQARDRLAGIADYWLLHDRDIVNRLDDSVARVMAGRPRLLRRARGYAPEVLRLPATFACAPPLLALGGGLKNTFCLLRDGQAVVSQHLGDLEEAAVQRDCREALDRYQRLFRHRPAAVAVDLHPRYFSTRLGEQLAQAQDLPLVRVQHHHAHVAAVMAEHGLGPQARVLGVALDGLGLGDDGTLWGGEFLDAGYGGFRRLAAFPAVPLAGGERAVREPWRSAYAQLHPRWEQLQARFGGLPALARLAARPVATLGRMMDQGFNSPPASSAGRLFDAAAALLDLHADGTTYEGQAAMALENLAAPSFHEAEGEAYPWSLRREGAPWRLDWSGLWEAFLADLAAGTPPARIAARFHHTVAGAVADTACTLAAETGLDTVALCGGVFQNRLLLEAVSRQLQTTGLRVLIPERYPLNDGALSLGQGVVAAYAFGTED